MVKPTPKPRRARLNPCCGTAPYINGGLACCPSCGRRKWIDEWNAANPLPARRARKPWKRWSINYLDKKQVAIVYGRGLEATFVWLNENVWSSQADVVRFIVRALNAARVVLPAKGKR